MDGKTKKKWNFEISLKKNHNYHRKKMQKLSTNQNDKEKQVLIKKHKIKMNVFT